MTNLFDKYVEQTGLTDSERRVAKRYIRNTMQVFTRVDRTLANRPNIIVSEFPLTQSDAFQRQVGGSSMGPAMSSRTLGKVCIDFTHRSFKGATEAEHLAHTMGLNYHELAHLLYTPQLDGLTPYDKFYEMSSVLSKGWQFSCAFNYLEDGRIERMLMARYGATRPYLTLSFLRMLKVASTMEGAWFYVAPRLGDQPEQVTDGVWNAIVTMPDQVDAAPGEPYRRFTDDQLNRVTAIAHEYKRLVFKNKVVVSKACKLIEEYAFIIDSTTETDTNNESNHTAESAPASGAEIEGVSGNRYARPPTNPVTPATDEEQEKAQKERDKQQKAEEKAAAAEAEADEDADNSDESDEDDAEGAGSGDDDTDDDSESEDGSQGQGGDDSDGDSDDDGDDESEDGDADGDDGETDDDSSSDDDGGEGGGESKTEGKPQAGGNGAGGAGQTREFDEAIDDLESLVEEALNETIESEVVQNDLESHRRSLRGHMVINTAPKLEAATVADVTPEMRLASRKIGKEFSRLQSRLDPGMERRTQSGKLNVSRFLRERELESAFDTWQEDRSDAADVEVVFAVDLSGSMSGLKIFRTSEALHVLRVGLQQIDAKITGIGFESNQHTLFERDSRASEAKFPVFSALGGTYLDEAIETIAGFMFRSRSKAKVLVVITDGEISSGYEETLASIRESGVVCAKFGIYSRGFNSDGDIDDLFDLSVTVSNPVEIIEPVRQIVRSLIKRKGNLR